MLQFNDADLENYNPMGSRKRMQMVVHVMEKIAMEVDEDDEGLSLDDLDNWDYKHVERSVMVKAEKHLREVNPTFTFFTSSAVEKQVPLCELKPLEFKIMTEDEVDYFHEESLSESDSDNEEDDDDYVEFISQSQFEHSFNIKTELKADTKDAIMFKDDEKEKVKTEKQTFTIESFPLKTLPAISDSILGNPDQKLNNKCWKPQFLHDYTSFSLKQNAQVNNIVRNIKYNSINPNWKQCPIGKFLLKPLNKKFTSKYLN